MSKVPDYIKKNTDIDKDYYSLYKMDNINKCKTSSDYLGEAIVANENLIWHSIHKYIGKPEVLARNNGMDKDDIFQLGRLGFIKAMKAFDTTRGIKFSSFAVTAIVREVRCFIRDSASIIRLSRTAHSLLNDIKRLENDLCYLPSTEEIAILLNENEDKIIKVMQIGNSVRYLDESVKYLGAKYDACTFTDMLTDTEVDIENDVVDKIYVSQVLNGIKNRLSDLEIKVLKGQIGGLSQAQIAKTNAISHMRVSRIVKKITSLIDNYKSHIPPV